MADPIRLYFDDGHHEDVDPETPLAMPDVLVENMSRNDEDMDFFKLADGQWARVETWKQLAERMIAECDAAIRRAEDAEEVQRLDTGLPLYAILERLADAADHAITEGGMDQQAEDEIVSARNDARDLAANLRRMAGVATEKGAPKP